MYIDHTDDYVVELSEEGMRRAREESRLRKILVTVTLEGCVVSFHALAPSTFDAINDAVELFFGVPMAVSARVA